MLKKIITAEELEIISRQRKTHFVEQGKFRRYIAYIENDDGKEYIYYQLADGRYLLK